jgi:hypothetical protein
MSLSLLATNELLSGDENQRGHRRNNSIGRIEKIERGSNYSFFFQMRHFIFILLILSQKNLLSQELIFDNGIYIEKPIFTDTSQHRYTLDNKIFAINKSFTYDYYFLDSFSVKRKFYKEGEGIRPKSPTGLAEYKSTSSDVIDKVRLIVTDDLNIFLRSDSSYSQTVVKYQYLNSSGVSIGSEETGVIENSMNLWLHPPRGNNFRILEINPFPFLSLQDTTSQWSWSMNVWESWSDSRWKDWIGTVELKYAYKRLGDESIDTKFGKLNCKVSEGIGSSKIGTTYLKSYFNEKYGFVRLEYTNINGTKLIIWLVAVDEKI